MKKITFIFLVFLVYSCSNGKQVYWCGDHPCINNKERKAYFKETMIVEIKELNKKKKEEYSEMKKITEQAFAKTKVKINKQKSLDKKKYIEEKKRIKREKKYARKLKKQNKQKIKNEKKVEKKSILKKLIINKKRKEKKIVADIGLVNIDLSEFSKLKDKIIKRNLSKPYPNINNIPD